MAKSSTKINYDKGVDILSISKDEKVKLSINVGDFVIDINYKGFVSGLEILSASKTLGLKKSQLENIKKGSMLVNYKPNYVHIRILLRLPELEKDISIPLTVDLKKAGQERMSLAVA